MEKNNNDEYSRCMIENNKFIKKYFKYNKDVEIVSTNFTKQQNYSNQLILFISLIQYLCYSEKDIEYLIKFMDEISKNLEINNILGDDDIIERIGKHASGRNIVYTRKNKFYDEIDKGMQEEKNAIEFIKHKKSEDKILMIIKFIFYKICTEIMTDNEITEYIRYESFDTKQDFFSVMIASIKNLVGDDKEMFYKSVLLIKIIKRLELLRFIDINKDFLLNIREKEKINIFVNMLNFLTNRTKNIIMFAKNTLEKIDIFEKNDCKIFKCYSKLKHDVFHELLYRIKKPYDTSIINELNTFSYYSVVLGNNMGICYLNSYYYMLSLISFSHVNMDKFTNFLEKNISTVERGKKEKDFYIIDTNFLNKTFDEFDNLFNICDDISYDIQIIARQIVVFLIIIRFFNMKKIKVYMNLVYYNLNYLLYTSNEKKTISGTINNELLIYMCYLLIVGTKFYPSFAYCVSPTSEDENSLMYLSDFEWDKFKEKKILLVEMTHKFYLKYILDDIYIKSAFDIKSVSTTDHIISYKIKAINFTILSKDYIDAHSFVVVFNDNLHNIKANIISDTSHINEVSYMEFYDKLMSLAKLYKYDDLKKVLLIIQHILILN